MMVALFRCFTHSKSAMGTTESYILHLLHFVLYRFSSDVRMVNWNFSATGRTTQLALATLTMNSG